MHTEPAGIGGVPIAASLPQPRTLLIGSPYVVRSVLERNRYPKLTPRESKLIAATTQGERSLSIGLFFDSIESMLAKANAEMDKQLDQLSKADKKRMKKHMGSALETTDDLNYLVKNMKYMTIDIDVGDKVEAVTRVECVNPWKAKKVVKILKKFMATSQYATSQLGSLSTSPPVAKGALIEGETSFDLHEFGDLFNQGIAARGF